MNVTVYAAVETYKGPGAGIYSTAVRTSLRLWLIADGGRLVGTTIHQLVPDNVHRLPDILEREMKEAAEREGEPFQIEGIVNGAPLMITSRPPISTTYMPLHENGCLNGLHAFAGRRTDTLRTGEMQS